MFSVIYTQTISAKKASFTETFQNGNGMFSLQHSTQFFSAFQQQTHSQFNKKDRPRKRDGLKFSIFNFSKQRCICSIRRENATQLWRNIG